MGAVELLHQLHGAGFRVDVAGDTLLVSPGDKLTDADCASIANNKPALLALLLPLARGPESLDLAAAWTDAEILAFLDRRARLLRWGWAEPEAESLADRLVRRDREVDQRVSCTDCRHYRPGHCGNHRRAGLNVPDVGRDLAAMLQRCPGFQPAR
jgi:hypothetical protein